MLFDLLIKSGTLVTHAGTGVTDVGIREGRIVAIGDLDSDRGWAVGRVPHQSRCCPLQPPAQN